MPEAEHGGRIRVVYVAGSPRSGTTILAQLLGALPGCAMVGELKLIWDRSFGENWACGCGVPFDACPVWNEIVARWHERVDLDVDEVLRLRNRLLTRDVGRLVRASRARRLGPEARAYGEAMQELYRCVAEVTGQPTIVDSSKSPADAVVLSATASLDVRVVHLVRDPRAIAHSWTRVEPDLSVPGGSTRRRGLLRTTLLWLHWNRAIRTHLPSVVNTTLVRYEDLCQDPTGEVERLAGRLSLPVAPLPFGDNGKLRLPQSHTVAGNRVRFHSGPVEVSLDDEWHGSLPRGKRLMVEALTLPWRRAYDY